MTANAPSIVGKRRGLELAEIHKMVGGSLRKLSAADASKWIEHFSGQQLPNPPGQKPSPYASRPQRTAATRMVHPDHVEHIERLPGDCFGDAAAGPAWLEKDFKVRHPRDLLTAKRAGQVIRVLKDMIDRRRSGGAAARPVGVEHEESGSTVGVQAVAINPCPNRVRTTSEIIFSQAPTGRVQQEGQADQGAFASYLTRRIGILWAE